MEIFLRHQLKIRQMVSISLLQISDERESLHQQSYVQKQPQTWNFI